MGLRLRGGAIDWDAEAATYLQGQATCHWNDEHDRFGNDRVGITFDAAACSINIVRFDAWLTGQPQAKTKQSAFRALRELFL
ncbi:hypothetical protein CCP2SC5_1390002 [Azospirillaceae bacterium]